MPLVRREGTMLVFFSEKTLVLFHAFTEDLTFLDSCGCYMLVLQLCNIGHFSQLCWRPHNIRLAPSANSPPLTDERLASGWWPGIRWTFFKVFYSARRAVPTPRMLRGSCRGKDLRMTLRQPRLFLFCASEGTPCTSLTLLVCVLLAASLYLLLPSFILI